MAQAAEEKAKKMIDLLSDNTNVSRLRKDGQFNFEQLSKGPSKITISDC